MGLFVNRPEEPSEWAGLPSEPLEPQSAAERLGASIDVGLFGDGAGSVSSITVALTPAEPEPAQDAD